MAPVTRCIKHEGFHAGVVTCPVCGKAARRETDTMDTFVDSSSGTSCATATRKTATPWWVAAPTTGCVTRSKAAKDGSGMDQYIGGIEHAILHLLYARFWTKVMRDLGLVKVDEPFTKLLTQGMVLNHIYSRRTDKGGKEYFWPHDVEHVLTMPAKCMGAKLVNNGRRVANGLPAGTPSTTKVWAPCPSPRTMAWIRRTLIEKYGADTARLYTMFTAPPEATLEWNDAAVEGRLPLFAPRLELWFQAVCYGWATQANSARGLAALND